MGDLVQLVVVCQVTEACNLGCGFCGYDRRLDRSRRDADPARLLRLGRSLGDLRRRTGRPVLVSWLGGEPLRWPPLAAIAETFRGEGLDLGVTTNGTTLGSRAARARLAATYREVTVSVDGLGARHDELRGWPGGFTFLRRVVPALAAERRGGVLRVNTILMRDNIDELPALCRELAGWGIDEITWNQLGGNDRPAFHAGHHLRPADVARLAALLPALRRELLPVRLLGGARYLERVAASSAGRALPVLDCAPGERFLFVPIGGGVEPCSFTALGLPLEVIGDPAALGEARARARPRSCEDCPSTQVFGKYET